MMMHAEELSMALHGLGEPRQRRRAPHSVLEDESCRSERFVRLTLWTVVDIVLRTTSLKLSSCVQEEKRSPVLRRKLTLMLLFGAQYL